MVWHLNGICLETVFELFLRDKYFRFNIFVIHYMVLQGFAGRKSPPGPADSFISDSHF